MLGVAVPDLRSTVAQFAKIARLRGARHLQHLRAMSDDDEDIVLLDRPVVYLEPDELLDDELGFDDETAEYVLARIDNDSQGVVVEELELFDIEDPRTS